jgi:hypothetical protein
VDWSSAATILFRCPPPSDDLPLKPLKIFLSNKAPDIWLNVSDKISNKRIGYELLFFFATSIRNSTTISRNIQLVGNFWQYIFCCNWNCSLCYLKWKATRAAATTTNRNNIIHDPYFFHKMLICFFVKNLALVPDSSPALGEMIVFDYHDRLWLSFPLFTDCEVLGLWV